MAATAAVVAAAPPMARVSDRLAARSMLGSALFGAIFLGASTSLPGIIVTVTAALRGQAALAAGNALGGIAAQTTFLALADLAHTRGALQRVAVSRKIMAELAMLVGLLGLVLVGMGAPEVVFGVHVVTPLLVLGYVSGMLVVRRQPGSGGDDPAEASTSDTPRSGEPDAPTGHGQGTSSLWKRYVLLVAVLAAAGTVLSLSVSPLAGALGLDLASAGALLTALATSTPELLTALSAARRGALELAVGDIAGGNAFDVLFLFAADVVALGALYPSLSSIHVLLAAVALVLNAVLLMGFIRRGEGIGGRMAPESVLVLAGYCLVVVALVLA